MFKKMSEKEIEIKQIEKLRMVQIYELDGTKLDVHSHGLTAIAVYYGEDQKMIMNEQEPYYELLISRVMELYLRSESKDTIMIDEDTKALLETGIWIRDNSMVKDFYQLTGETFPVIPIEMTLGKRFLPMIEYLLTALYKVMDLPFVIEKRRSGWRGSAILTAKALKAEKELCISTERASQKEYVVLISEFLDPHVYLEVQIQLLPDGICFLFESSDHAFYGKGMYQFERLDQTLVKYEVFYQERKIFLDEELFSNCKLMEESELSGSQCRLLGEAFGQRRIYQLPWKQYYIYEERESETNGQKMTEKCGSFLWDDVLEQYCWTELYNVKSKIHLQTRCASLFRILLEDGRIQTYFEDTVQNSSGAYKEKLANHYFFIEDKG